MVPQVTGGIKHGHQQQLFSELTRSPLALSPKVARCSLIALCANSRGFFFLSRSFPAGLSVSAWDQGAAPQGGGGGALSQL